MSNVAATASTAVAPADQPPLDEMMLAMDVVDTLRHGEALAERELSGEARRARMIERLREIYRGQGIEVSDRILAEGVDALEQDRFVYKPRTGGFAFTLARLYVRRAAIARTLGIVLLVGALGWAGWHFLVDVPRQQAAEQLRVELSETLPQRLAALRTEIGEVATDPAVAAEAATIATGGIAAAASGNAAEARQAVASLEGTLSELKQTFDVRIVSRPGADTGITRIPEDNPNTENFYLVVEAIGPDGKAIPRSIKSEEDGSTRTVSMWAVRVPEAVFEGVRRDKLDDGIVQDSILGEKPRGSLTIAWRKPVLSGAITSW